MHGTVCITRAQAGGVGQCAFADFCGLILAWLAGQHHMAGVFSVDGLPGHGTEVWAWWAMCSTVCIISAQAGWVGWCTFADFRRLILAPINIGGVFEERVRWGCT